MSESRRRLQQPAISDELGGDSVAKAVQSRLFGTGGDTETAEPV